jgi:hypothetical protein
MIYSYPLIDDDTSDDDGEERQQKNDPSSLIESHEEFDWPLIPQKGDTSLDQAKSVIRAYVTATYRE